MPFKIPSVHLAQASPSLSLEKGSYRMRAPPSRPAPAASIPPPPYPHRRPHGAPGADAAATVLVPASYEKRMALLVALLACAMVASFGAAYWLWSTGLRAHAHGSRSPF